MLLHERDTYEAPHWGFITSILHKVNQLSKMKIKLFKCYLDVWIKDRKWITLKQKSDFKWILHLISFYDIPGKLHIAIVNSFIASQTQKTLNMLLPGIWANM